MSTDDDAFAESDVAEDEDEQEIARSDGATDSFAYDADEFDAYSDSSEPVGGDSGADRVHVFWTDENEWFAGSVTRVDQATYYVQYDDGEAAWETPERMRLAPEAFGFATRGFHQLQLLVALSSPRMADGSGDATSALLRSRVLVYCADSASWFSGCITSVDAAARALQVEYEDGDVRWEQDHSFANILVLASAARSGSESSEQEPPPFNRVTLETQQGQAPAPPPPETQSLPPPPPPAPSPHQPERVLVPRAYKAAVADHFRPERTPHPYVSVTTTLGSVVTARSSYSERRYLHSTLECTLSRSVHHADSLDCVVQTEIAADEKNECGAARLGICPHCGC
ncbi:hypothetical protein PybrP1_006240 [[Pythium] brassicae (nom. inval.)]|nr:hypothetical protein PybrP1_006240 [[Pythium] brassicae (nom. inval.)]